MEDDNDKPKTLIVFDPCPDAVAEAKQDAKAKLTQSLADLFDEIANLPINKSTLGATSKELLNEIFESGRSWLRMNKHKEAKILSEIEEKLANTRIANAKADGIELDNAMKQIRIKVIGIHLQAQLAKDVDVLKQLEFAKTLIEDLEKEREKAKD